MKKLSKGKNRSILVVAVVALVVVVSQGLAWEFSHSGKSELASAQTADNAINLADDTSKSFASYADQLTKVSVTFAKAINNLTISRKLSPLFISKSSLTDYTQSNNWLVEEAALSRSMASAVEAGNTTKAATELTAIVTTSSHDQQTFIEQQAYKQLGTVSYALLKPGAMATGVLLDLDRSVPVITPGTTLLDVASKPTKYNDFTLYEILDGNTLGLYALSLDVDRDLSGEQKILQLEQKYISLLTQYATPAQKANLASVNKVAYANAAFQLARVDYLLGDYGDSSTEIAASKALDPDMQSVDSRYDALVSLLAERGHTSVPTRIAASAPATSNNLAACTNLTAAMNNVLGPLNDQITSQLSALKQMAANHQQASTIMGGVFSRGITGMVNQSQWAASFNAASDKVNSLISQYGVLKDQYNAKLSAIGCPSQ
jgi:hypothetical protein